MRKMDDIIDDAEILFASLPIKRRHVPIPQVYNANDDIIALIFTAYIVLIAIFAAHVFVAYLNVLNS